MVKQLKINLIIASVIYLLLFFIGENYNGNINGTSTIAKEKFSLSGGKSYFSQSNESSKSFIEILTEIDEEENESKPHKKPASKFYNFKVNHRVKLNYSLFKAKYLDLQHLKTPLYKLLEVFRL